MEITLYPKLDIRSFKQHYKNFDSVAPLLSQVGNDLVINSKTSTQYNQQIPIYCDNLTLKGKFTLSIVLHGNCNFVLEDAELFNLKNAYSTIEIADDFTGSVTLKNSYVHFKATNSNPRCIQYAINQFINNDNLTLPYRVCLDNSTIDGCILKVNDLILTGDVKLNAIDNNRLSILNAVHIDASNAHLITNYATLVSNNADSNLLAHLEITAGPVQLVGYWQIDQLTINETAQSVDDLVKVGNNQNSARLELHNLNIIKIKRNHRALKIVNSEVYLIDGKLDKALASTKDSILHFKGMQDQLDWSVLGDNGLDLDKQSLTNLRMQKDKFVQMQKMPAKQVTTETTAPQLKQDKAQPLTNKEITHAHKDEDNQQNQDIDDAIDPASAAKKLHDLIGLQSVKNTLQTYINQAKMNKRRRQMGVHQVKATSRHMVFMGNPGVGKTTVAKLVTGILYENGAIDKNKFVFCQVKELVGTHLGETQKATHKKFEQAMGGVLFIDEAHTLANDDLYSKEATKQILQDSENYADQIITILAGYPAEMENYLEHGDPGLKSRFPNQINFPDYSKHELLQIFKLFMRNDHQLIDQRIYKTKVFAYELLYYAGLTKDSDQPQANARSIRNFYDRLMQLRDNRLVTMNDPSSEDLMTVTSKDFATLYKEIRVKLQQVRP